MPPSLPMASLSKPERRFCFLSSFLFDILWYDFLAPRTCLNVRWMFIVELGNEVIEEESCCSGFSFFVLFHVFFHLYSSFFVQLVWFSPFHLFLFCRWTPCPLQSTPSELLSCFVLSWRVVTCVTFKNVVWENLSCDLPVFFELTCLPCSHNCCCVPSQKKKRKSTSVNHGSRFTLRHRLRAAQGFQGPQATRFDPGGVPHGQGYFLCPREGCPSAQPKLVSLYKWIKMK